VGTIRARGRIASLLEVGTGFHSEMTGRENIFLNGAILGMTKAEIASKLDEIVDFSGCERYLDTPVKRYSSGMTVRLGFAVAAFLDPEILVVDEVLAVGDAEFQKKAIGKMQDVSRGEGRTVLFVSHNMASVKQLCKSGILLENGAVKSIGSIHSIVDQYITDNMDLLESDKSWQLENAPGGGGIKVLRCATEYEGNELTADKPFDLVYEFYCEQDGLIVGLNPHVFNRNEVCLFNVGSGHKPLEKGYHIVKFHVPAGLFCAGTYRIDNLFYSRASEYFFHRGAHTFTIENVGKFDFTNYIGVIYPKSITAEFDNCIL
jgi:lipopolysaccharide transport system ATP-binding protein